MLPPVFRNSREVVLLFLSIRHGHRVTFADVNVL